ncbi:molybdopterin synthase sulfur carrier subunit [Chloroflexota bacterium]
MECTLDSFLSQYANNQQLSEVNGNTVIDCLYHLTEQFPALKTVIFDEDGYLNGFITVFVNGEGSQLDYLLNPVRDGDELSIELSIGGC